jgi:hypothetical protein
MQLFTLDPLLDPRWNDLVTTHPWASAFHQKGWLEALARTYRYRPVVLTSNAPDEPLTNGIAFCEVRSWITGTRLVSLPFADHSEPLLNDQGDPFKLASWMQTECLRNNWKYIELRPVSSGMCAESSFMEGESYWLHTLDLAPSLEEIFHNCHSNCIQRRVRRAQRECLSYEKGCSEALIEDFYRLTMITRRRHFLLPQPISWFRNLVACMSPNVEIRLVRKGNDPVAAILTLKHRDTVIYKYGCSNEKFHHLAGMPFLFWNLIEESKTAGAAMIDFGRTDLENTGLIKFKDRLGAVRKRITYFRYPRSQGERSMTFTGFSPTRRLASILPDALSSMAGEMVYRHIG